MEIAIGVAAGAILAIAGFVFGRSSGRSLGLSEGASEAASRIKAVAESVARGQSPEDAPAGSPEAELHSALERGWSPREAERNVALVEAIGRVSTFLETNVRKPLSEAGQAAEADELRERIEYALGALSDIDFFLEKPSMSRSGQSLVSLVEHVAHEFSGDQDIRLRLQLDSSPVRAVISGPVIMDVLYLILHNAARFGGDNTIDIAVQAIDGRSLILVRDHGPGFSDEALQRAFDPFYSTSPEGLGLGLPHARSLIAQMGGQIELRNVSDGGAEVEVSFPSS